MCLTDHAILKTKWRSDRIIMIPVRFYRMYSSVAPFLCPAAERACADNLSCNLQDGITLFQELSAEQKCTNLAHSCPIYKSLSAFALTLACGGPSVSCTHGTHRTQIPDPTASHSSRPTCIHPDDPGGSCKSSYDSVRIPNGSGRSGIDVEHSYLDWSRLRRLALPTCSELQFPCTAAASPQRTVVLSFASGGGGWRLVPHQGGTCATSPCMIQGNTSLI
jgi:hypothetical protein